MSRRRQKTTPWIQRWSRYIIGAIAIIGTLVTAYLTWEKLFGQGVACATEGCVSVLSSPYADVFGIPLTIFGFLAYATMGVLALGPLTISLDRNKELRLTLEGWSWQFLLIGSLAMATFSGYLMYVLAFKLQAVCPYCIASAIFSLTLLTLTLLGRDWEDFGQIAFTGVVVVMVTVIGTLGVYSHIDNPAVADNPTSSTTTVSGDSGPPVVNTSGPAELALAEHLNESGAKMYGAYWCPHCHDQKELFGQEAAQIFPYIECAQDGANSQANLCREKIDAGILTGYPTWEIDGEYYAGTQTLNRLADLTNYEGSRDFRN